VLLSLTVTPRAVKLPPVVGVPVIVPALLMLNPLGQPESEYESGAVPPVVVIVCENAVPAVSVVRAAPLAGLVIVKTVGVVGGLMVRE